MIGITKKIGWLLMAVALVTLSLPIPTARAVATTVEVNNGNTIALNVGENITGSATVGIPITAKNIAVSANATGLAAFDFTLKWNPSVIRMDTVRKSTTASNLGWEFTTGAINNTTGTVRFLGTTTQTPYSKANLTLAYLGITAVGGRGDTTTITVTITNLTDNKLLEITPRTAVNAPVQIRAESPLQTKAGSLVSIELVPTDPSIALGQTQQFTAIGTLDDKSSTNITNVVTWTSSNTTVATISAAGLATSLMVGTTTITATRDTIHGIATLTVTKAEGEAVTPPSEKKEVTSTPPSEKEKPETTTPPEEKKTATTLPPAEAAVPPAITLKGINWWLISGIIAGVVLLGLVAYFLMRKLVI